MDKAMNFGSTQTTSFARLRNESYALLASLLGQSPGKSIKNILRNLTWEEDIPGLLASSLAALRAAGDACGVSAMQAEFNKLFIGLGSGEVIPSASWYLEKRIQSRPLARLRADLNRLGIVRQGGEHTPEDAASALCEAMAIISGPEGNYAPDLQAGFFEHHLASWMGLFFRDLQSAKSAVFYRSVGQFGLHFMESESRYWGCHLNSVPWTRRRNGYEKGAQRQPACLS
ncbi:MAG: molecular chaperone [Smithellaceae bacterium]